MKSHPLSTDAMGMHLLADAGPFSTMTLVTALIAGGVMLLSLKAIAAEMDYARRVETLQQQVRVLREKQAERLRNLLPKRR